MGKSIDIGIRTSADLTGVQKTDQSVSALVDSLRKATVAAGQSETQFLAAAGALSRQALAAGDAARADAILENANKGLAASAQQVTTSTQQLGTAQAQAGQGTQGLSSALGVLKGAFGALGIAVSVKKVLDFGVASGQAALSLKETQNTLRIVAGDTNTYNRIVDEARRQQILFGGSLEENIGGLSGLAVTSRKTGADLGTLIDLQKRLTLLNPAQSAQGGLIALNEALDGNLTSIQRRFNVTKSDIKALGDESLPVAERLKVLDSYLNSVGITSRAITDRVDENAETFRILAQKIGDAKNALGTFLTVSTAQVVRIIIDPGKEAGRQGVDTRTQAGELAKQAQTYQDYVASINQANSQIEVVDPMSGATNIGAMTALTEAQFNYSRALQASGVAAEEATRKSFALSDADAVRAQGLVELNALDGRREAIQAMQAGQTAALIAASQQLGGAMDAERQAAAGLQVATGLAASDIQRSAQASQLDAAQKDMQQQKVALLQAQTRATVEEFLRLNPAISASEAASKAAAQGYSAQIGQLAAIAIEADHARFELNRMNLEKNLAIGANASAGRSLGTGPQVGGALGGGMGQVGNQMFAQNNALRDSENALALARAKNHQEKIAILQRELGQTNDQIKKNGILAQIEGEKNAIAAEAERAAKGQATAANKLATAEQKRLTLNEGIYDSINKQKEALLDIEELTIRDRQQDREDAAKAKVAQRILGSASASADIKARAQDALALMDVQNRKREFDIAQKQATVGGSIVNGKLLQSVPTGAVPAPASIGAAANVASAPTTAQAGAAVQGQVLTLVLQDSAGGVIAKSVGPIIFDQLLTSVRSVQLTKGL